MADEPAHDAAAADGGSLSRVRHGIDGSTALVGQQRILGLVPCAVFATMSHPIVLFFDEPKVNPINIRVRDRPDALWPVLAGGQRTEQRTLRCRLLPLSPPGRGIPK